MRSVETRPNDSITVLSVLSMASAPSGLVPQSMVMGTDEYGLADLGRLSGQNL